MLADRLYVVIGCDGHQYGPVPERIIQEWLLSGRLTLDTLSWSMGESAWQPLSARSFKQPFTMSANPPTAPPPAMREMHDTPPASTSSTNAHIESAATSLATSPKPTVPEDNPVVQVAKNSWTPFVRYEKTRTGVRNGVALYDYSKAQLAASDFMGPWTFNLTESILIGLPIIFLTKVFTFLWPYTPPAPVRASPLAVAIGEIFPGVLSFLQAILVPLTLTAVSGLCARASLRSRDSTPASRRRARYAYLYFDGAYGSVAQVSVGLVISLATWFYIRSAWTPPMIIAVVLLAFYGWGHGLYVVGYLIPRKLFLVNGYGPGNPGPLNKYQFAIVFIVPFIALGILFVFILVSYFIAILLALVKVAT
jgi:hypothetical protein